MQPGWGGHLIAGAEDERPEQVSLQNTFEKGVPGRQRASTHGVNLLASLRAMSLAPEADRGGLRAFWSAFLADHRDAFRNLLAALQESEAGSASVARLNTRMKAVNRAIQSLALTRILIAHRPETILSAERVVVLTGGKVVDDLSTAELLARQAAASASAETAAEAGR